MWFINKKVVIKSNIVEYCLMTCRLYINLKNHKDTKDEEF